VEIRNLEQFSHACLEPLRFSEGLAFGAVAIAARIVGDPLMTARIALIHMAAQSGGPAGLNGPYGAPLLARHRRAIQFPVLCATVPENIGELQFRPAHFGWAGSVLLGNRSNGLVTSARDSVETWV